MLRFVLRRLSQTLAVLFTVSVIVFALIRLIPGDPVYTMLGSEYTEQAYRDLRGKLGLDRSLLTQYLLWIGDVSRGDFGYCGVYALGRELESRGAIIKVVKLPAGPDGQKIGLDDYLLRHSAETFPARPRLSLKDAPLSRLAPWYKSWTTRKAATEESADALRLLERGETTRTLHPAQDVLDGVLYYGVPAGDNLVVVSSERQALTAVRRARTTAPAS